MCLVLSKYYITTWWWHVVSAICNSPYLSMLMKLMLTRVFFTCFVMLMSLGYYSVGNAENLTLFLSNKWAVLCLPSFLMPLLGAPRSNHYRLLLVNVWMSACSIWRRSSWTVELRPSWSQSAFIAYYAHIRWSPKFCMPRTETALLQKTERLAVPSIENICNNFVHIVARVYFAR